MSSSNVAGAAPFDAAQRGPPRVEPRIRNDIAAFSCLADFFDACSRLFLLGLASRPLTISAICERTVRRRSILFLSQAVLALTFSLDHTNSAEASVIPNAPISKSFAAEDIRYALKRAEAVHPHLFWYISRQSVTAHENALISALPDPATPMEVYLTLSRLFATMGDGHIAVDRPPGQNGDLLDDYMRSGGVLLRIIVRPVAGALRVSFSQTKGVTAGDTLH